MECDGVRTRLSALIDGELAPDEGAAVRQHLASCASCRAEADGLRRLANDMKPALTPPSVTPEEWDAVILAAVSRHGERFGWFLLAPALLALVAGALVALFTDGGIPLWVRVALGSVSAGLVFLLASAAADRWRDRKAERYGQVHR